MTEILYILANAIFIYFVAYCLVTLILICLGAIKVREYHSKSPEGVSDHITKSPVVLPISVIIPAHNEEVIIVSTVENTLKLHYPIHEVIVVDDGSTDATLPLLIERFNLERIERHKIPSIKTHEVRDIYESKDHPNLVVITKENGHRADAVNVGVNISRFPLLCVIDADCVLERDGLQHMVRPFLFDPDLAAAGGVVRPSNGLKIKNGVIEEYRLPHTLLGLNQEVEYLRSFQWTRIGLNRLNSMFCISGALLLIKKSVLEQTGGSWPGAITDDFEYSMRLHRFVFDRKAKRDRKWHIAFIPDAVSYTEVPEKLKLYLDQRNRWQRGILQAILRHRSMFLNPRYGITGLFGMPYFVFFEALAPIIELTAYICAIILLVIGKTSWQQLLALVFLAHITCIFLTLLTMLISETSRFRTNTWKDFWKTIFSVVLDNFGWHQLRVFVSVWGTLQFLVMGRTDLGVPMTRIHPKTNIT